MNTQEIIALARKHLLESHGPMSSSALQALTDATRLYEDGDYTAAKRRACHSLRYSVGILHKDYQRVAKDLYL